LNPEFFKSRFYILFLFSSQQTMCGLFLLTTADERIREFSVRRHVWIKRMYFICFVHVWSRKCVWIMLKGLVPFNAENTILLFYKEKSVSADYWKDDYSGYHKHILGEIYINVIKPSVAMAQTTLSVYVIKRFGILLRSCDRASWQIPL
jgi:hypothetical protein